MTQIASAILVVLTTLLASCAGPAPLSSTPPAKKLVVKESFTWGDGFAMKKMTFPAGDYLPKLEDRAGYYFVAPGAGIHVLDTPFGYDVEGGIIWKRGSDKPSQLYHTTPVTKMRAPLPWGNAGRLEAVEIVR